MSSRAGSILATIFGHGGALVQAALAAAAGLCRPVLVYRCTWEPTSQARARDGQGEEQSLAIAGDKQWRIPFGAFSAANSIALNAGANAALNPNAVYRDLVTMDDYLSAQMISTPLGLYDCDGAVALIVSATDAARDTRRPDPLPIEAVGTQTTERRTWDNGLLDHETLIRGAATLLWERTDLKPADVEVAQLYDGFTFNCLSWIELLGFCPGGEGGRSSRAASARARRRAGAQHAWSGIVRRAVAGFLLPPRGLRAIVGRGRRAAGAQ